MSFPLRRFAVYETATGRVLQVSSTPNALEVEAVLQEGQAFVEVGADVAYDTHFILDGEPVEMGERPSPAHEFDWNTHEWADPRTLDDFKAAKWEEIKRARDAEEFGGFEWDGSVFDSDMASQSRIQGAAQLAQMSPDFTIDWTLQDNTVRTLSAQDLLQIGAALGLHVSYAHAYARTLRQQIEAATTATQVSKVEW